MDQEEFDKNKYEKAFENALDEDTDLGLYPSFYLFPKLAIFA